MPKIDIDTKQKILIAAEKIFHANGFKGTRTSLIAEEAGISRTMLHYYYSTKEALFQEVLNNTLSAVWIHAKRLIAQPLLLEEMIGELVDIISDLFELKPGLPSFIVNILNESPDIAIFLSAAEQDNLPVLLEKLLEQERVSGKIAQDITGEDLIINIYALCAIPYLGAAYIKAKENRDDEGFKQFMSARRAKTKAFILRGVRKLELDN